MLLGEEILLLLLNEKKDQLKKGTLDHSDLNYLLPATILEDLRMLGRIKIESEGKKASIKLIDETATNNQLLDELLSDIIAAHEQGNSFNFVKYIQAVGHKKRKWQERFWRELENNGIIQNVKKKHILVKPEAKENLINDISDTVGRIRDAGDRVKSLIAFYKYLPGAKIAKLISKKCDKDWLNELTENQVIPKTVGKKVIVPARWKKAKKIITITSAVQAQVSYAGSSFGAQVSGTAAPSQDKLVKLSIKGADKLYSTPGDTILEGVKKLKEKRSEKKEEKKSEEIELNI